jgi:hypothetical protein
MMESKKRKGRGDESVESKCDNLTDGKQSRVSEQSREDERWLIG